VRPASDPQSEPILLRAVHPARRKVEDEIPQFSQRGEAATKKEALSAYLRALRLAEREVPVATHAALIND